jgi:hypothetical protein
LFFWQTIACGPAPDFGDDFNSVKRWDIISKESTSATVDQFCGHVSQIMKNHFKLTGG